MTELIDGHHRGLRPAPIRRSPMATFQSTSCRGGWIVPRCGGLVVLIHLSGCRDCWPWLPGAAGLHAMSGMRFGDMTNMMRIPTYPFQFAIAYFGRPFCAGPASGSGQGRRAPNLKNEQEYP